MDTNSAYSRRYSFVADFSIDHGFYSHAQESRSSLSEEDQKQLLKLLLDGPRKQGLALTSGPVPALLR